MNKFKSLTILLSVLAKQAAFAKKQVDSFPGETFHIKYYNESRGLFIFDFDILVIWVYISVVFMEL